MNKTLVSIIIAAYNAERHLGKTLESLLVQTWKDIEIVVVNDGSTDNTALVLQNYPSVKVVYQENLGQDAAFNKGFKHSTGTYIKFMDSDDLLNPEMIEIQVKKLLGNKDYIAYGEWARFIGDEWQKADFTPLKYWKDASPIDFLASSSDGVMLQCGIMLMHRDLIESTTLWDERLILFNDTEYYTRLILNSKGVRFTKDAKLYYRSGQRHSISVGRTEKFYQSTFLATELVAATLLKHEDSLRTRTLVSNMYANQYFQFYPRYEELGKAHEAKILEIGHCTVQPEGGRLFRIACRIFGWKKVARFKLFVYRIGYAKLLKPDAQKNIDTKRSHFA